MRERGGEGDSPLFVFLAFQRNLLRGLYMLDRALHERNSLNIEELN